MSLLSLAASAYHARRKSTRSQVDPGGHSRWPYRLIKAERGATMVEFALVVLPFLLLLLGAFDIGFYYWGSEELENATVYGARLVRTGQVQAAGRTPGQTARSSS